MRDFTQNILKELSKYFSAFSTYSSLNDTRREIIGTIIKNELRKYVTTAAAWTH
jgi:hypothetical protein